MYCDYTTTIWRCKLNVDYDEVSRLFKIRDFLCLVISNFNASCRTPQLLSLTSACAMDLVELLMKVTAEMEDSNQIFGLHKYGIISMNEIRCKLNVDYDEDLLPLTTRPIRLETIKVQLESNRKSWNLKECFDILKDMFKVWLLTFKSILPCLVS